MKFEQEKVKIVTPKCFFEDSVTQSVDEQLNLPDYCSDIKRILKCSLTPDVVSVQISGDRVNVRGSLLIRLLYVNDDEKIDCFDKTAEFTKYTDVKNMPENACAYAAAEVEYVNCRAESQRRAAVSASVAVNIKIFGAKESELPVIHDSADFQTLTHCVKAVSGTVTGEKTFDLSETIELGETEKPIGKIVSRTAVALIESVKAVTGKLLIKGELKLEIVYCEDSDERGLVSRRHDMPISQIVELPGLTEDGTNNVRLFVRSLILEPKTDASGKCRLLEAAAKVSAVVCSTVESDIKVISDCYCTECETESEYRELDFLSLAQTLEKNDSISRTVELPCTKIGSVLDARAVKCSAEPILDDKGLLIKATAAVEVIFTDEEGRLQTAQRSVDFDIEESLKKPCEKIRCHPVLTVTGVKCEPEAENKAKLSLGFYIMADVFAVTSERVLVSVKPDEEKKKPKKDCTIAVCYCKKGESLWSIAKKYNTVLSGIKEENGIETDTVNEDRMIMIPC